MNVAAVPLHQLDVISARSYGEHFCLGAHLARLDLTVFFRQLATRLQDIELAGPVEWLHASFVGGPKRVPVRWRLRPTQ